MRASDSVMGYSLALSVIVHSLSIDSASYGAPCDPTCLGPNRVSCGALCNVAVCATVVREPFANELLALFETKVYDVAICATVVSAPFENGLLALFYIEACDVEIRATVVCAPFKNGLVALFETKARAAVICAYDAWLPIETGTKVSAQ